MTPVLTGSAIAGLGTLLALMTAVWAASVARRDVSIVDICWSLAILAAAGVYASGADDLTLRRGVVLAAVGSATGVSGALRACWRAIFWGRNRRIATVSRGPPRSCPGCPGRPGATDRRRPVYGAGFRPEPGRKARSVAHCRYVKMARRSASTHASNAVRASARQ